MHGQPLMIFAYCTCFIQKDNTTVINLNYIFHIQLSTNYLSNLQTQNGLINPSILNYKYSIFKSFIFSKHKMWTMKFHCKERHVQENTYLNSICDFKLLSPKNGTE